MSIRVCDIPYIPVAGTRKVRVSEILVVINL